LDHLMTELFLPSVIDHLNEEVKYLLSLPPDRLAADY
jgi:hypothetical protein